MQPKTSRSRAFCEPRNRVNMSTVWSTLCCPLYNRWKYEFASASTSAGKFPPPAASFAPPPPAPGAPPAFPPGVTAP